MPFSSTTPCVLSFEPGARVLLDEQDRPALAVHQLDHLEDDPAGLRVEPHRRLVEHDQRRVEHQAAGELDQPLLAPGEAAGLLAARSRDDREQLLDGLQPLLRPAPGRGS